LQGVLFGAAAPGWERLVPPQSKVGLAPTLECCDVRARCCIAGPCSFDLGLAIVTSPFCFATITCCYLELADGNRIGSTSPTLSPLPVVWTKQS
jgi:hypothetical protein